MRPLIVIAAAIGVYFTTYLKPVEDILLFVRIPVMTYLCIVALCLFNSLILRTRLGQNMRTVGQSQVVANAAGLDVDRYRIIAMIISTVLACWGQLIYLQNMGTFPLMARIHRPICHCRPVSRRSFSTKSRQQTSYYRGNPFHTLLIRPRKPVKSSLTMPN